MSDFSLDTQTTTTLQDTLDPDDLTVLDTALDAIGKGLGLGTSDNGLRIVTPNEGLGGTGGQVEVVLAPPGFFPATTRVELGQGVDGVIVQGNSSVNIAGNDGDNLNAGGGGGDSVSGGAGNDTILGGAGDDFVVSTTGNDSIGGGAGNDVVYGGSGNDTLSGGTGNDILDGGSESDSITGGAGDDSISGGSEADTLVGGEGNDSIFGGSGNDSITGGAGSDVFIFTANGGADRITDFQAGIDKIEVARTDDTISSLVSGASTSGSDTVITLADGSTITVVGVTGVQADWFIVS